MLLIEHMDMIWLSVTQKYLISVYYISIPAKKKKVCEDRERGIFRKIKNTRHGL